MQIETSFLGESCLFLQCFGFSKSLESILQIEQGLDAIRKQRNSSKEKLDSIQKQASFQFRLLYSFLFVSI